jgi:hypothetical protein
MQHSNAARREQEVQQYHPNFVSSNQASKQQLAKELGY